MTEEQRRQMVEAIPAATYTCQDCALSEDQDLMWEPDGKRWVCGGCYDQAMEGSGPSRPVYISEVLAEEERDGEALHLLRLIDVEFQTSPMSVMHFDLTAIVEPVHAYVEKHR